MKGLSLIAGGTASQAGAGFQAVNPATGEKLEPHFYSASQEELEQATHAAEAAFTVYKHVSGTDRATFLRKIAEGLTSAGEEIVARANLETGLPLPRLNGELGRTTGQLRLFADVAEEGSWVDARIDEAQPDRKPLPRADVRSMLRPLGPVAVFGASNFPLAFSVAGGDTAAALAAGCPVIVKAHPAHPGTSELVGNVIQAAVAACGLPAGVFSLLFDAATSVGAALVVDPRVKAVGFTGSAAGGHGSDEACSRPGRAYSCLCGDGQQQPRVSPAGSNARSWGRQQALIAEKTLVAPFAGRLGVRQVDLGQFLQPGTKVVTLQALDPIAADFYVPQQSLGGLHVGEPVAITTDAYPGRPFTAGVSAITPQVDQASRTVLVRAIVGNRDHALIPGMFVGVTLATGRPEMRLTLPQSAISFAPYGDTVFVVRHDAHGRAMVHQAAVATGARRGDQVAIVSGLAAGDVVVSAGQTKLHEGTPVVVNNTIQPDASVDLQLPEE